VGRLAFFSGQPRCLVAMEACASAHYWAREIAALGRRTRLIAPAYVKPFVKRQKNDMADAEAICEAAQRPTMRFVTPKSAEAQASTTVFRARDLLVRQRTQMINALRGPQGRYSRDLARAHALEEAAHAGDRRSGQQDRAHRLGADGARRDLSSSGRGGVTPAKA
jgi:transposase